MKMSDDKGTGRTCCNTSAIVKILYISGKITGATNGICVSVTSRVNSAQIQHVVRKGGLKNDRSYNFQVEDRG